MSTGRIEKALSGFYYVNVGGVLRTCRARGKFRRAGMSPLVGDWVEVLELDGGGGMVEKILERKNVFSRPAAANIDQLVIFASAAIPVTDPYLIDRVSAIARLKGCEVLVCLNKCDLDPAEELYDIYRRSAIPVLRISAETGEGLDGLRAAIREMDSRPTVFIVSQRTSSIQQADQIIVLDDGAVAGVGTHQQLLDSCQVYREIYDSQFKKEARA